MAFLQATSNSCEVADRDIWHSQGDKQVFFTASMANLESVPGRSNSFLDCHDDKSKFSPHMLLAQMNSWLKVFGNLFYLC